MTGAAAHDADAKLGRSGWLWLLVVAAVGVAAAWAPTLNYGLASDDYLFSRPWRWGDVHRVLYGNWDPTRVSAAFYRPLTSWFYALRFELFGLNGYPQHLLSLALMTVCAVLAGGFVWRECRSRRAGLLTAFAYAVHPAMAYAQAVWLTNQMHLLSSGFVLLGLLAWQYARDRGAFAWLWVLGVQVVAFGVKEDTVMLVPLLVVLTVLRRLSIGDIRWPHWGVVALAVVCPVALFLFRYDVLGRFGGYGAWPGFEKAWTNYSHAFGVFTLEPAHRPWQALASGSVKVLLVVGGLLTLRSSRLIYLFVAGVVMAAIFNLPFVFVTKVEQYHLIALGAAVAMAAAIEGALRSVSRPALRVGVAAACAVPLVAFVPLSRHMAADFSPCSPVTLSTDAIVVDWPFVPHEVRDWLKRKPDLCRSGEPESVIESVPAITWAFWREPGDDGQAIQWTSAEATIMVTAAASRLTIAVRQPSAAPESPVSVTLSGSTATRIERIDDGEWRRVEVPLVMSALTWVRGMHRIELDVDPTFVPALTERGNRDVRRLGVQLRIIGVE